MIKVRLRRGERSLRLLIQDQQGEREDVVEESLELEHLGEKVMKEMTRQARQRPLLKAALLLAPGEVGGLATRDAWQGGGLLCPERPPLRAKQGSFGSLLRNGCLGCSAHLSGMLFEDRRGS